VINANDAKRSAVREPTRPTRSDFSLTQIASADLYIYKNIYLVYWYRFAALCNAFVLINHYERVGRSLHQLAVLFISHLLPPPLLSLSFISVTIICHIISSFLLPTMCASMQLIPGSLNPVDPAGTIGRRGIAQRHLYLHPWSNL